jgi:transposase
LHVRAKFDSTELLIEEQLMIDLPMLSEAQMRRIEPYFPLSHGLPRVDDRRVLSGIVYVLKNGLRWSAAPPGYGPHKTLYSRFVRWTKLGVFNRIFAAKGPTSPRRFRQKPLSPKA